MTVRVHGEQLVQNNEQLVWNRNHILMHGGCLKTGPVDKTVTTFSFPGAPFTLLPLLQTASFLHMHLGIDASGLSPDLDCHHLVVNDWSNLEDPLNVCIASVPTQFDPSLAPPGKAVVHTYTAGRVWSMSSFC